jgi:hypothetical protein
VKPERSVPQTRKLGIWNVARRHDIFLTKDGSRTIFCHRGKVAAIIVVGLGVVATANIAASDAGPQPSGEWKLIRSANPRGGADSVSMIHTADTTRSDLNLAGLMLRCSELRPEVIVVVVSPFSPRAHPTVIIGANDGEWRFEASVVSPGAELLLPAEASTLAAGRWQSAHELSVEVSSQDQSFGGVIPIDGLSAALEKLRANCPAG